ncbi:ribonuclease H-like domain-containing protein [Annulohypoxylon maeteangense]|uniref:ribonuclease H-like domain-containing protein n=1 Tax=Annulohypoxylon maeteangense TaxID=1927788 RepID=UPI0020083F54|nr:ribonuclease H-like domain-containing protein [Annulohypoxylon maeteangense]KAI0880255.1 ribonuclease H-like domain-containing protein [Annulohypoxylon maeteangense]
MDVLRVWMKNSTNLSPAVHKDESEQQLDSTHCSLTHEENLEREFVIFNTQEKVLRLQSKYSRSSVGELELQARMKTVTVSILGTCKSDGPGRRPIRAFWGVYFGENSTRNVGGRLNPSLPQNCIFAKIEALSQALHIFQEDFAHDNTIRAFHIMTDLDPLVRPVLGWVEDWIGRSSVDHYPILNKIDHPQEEMMYDHCGGLSFKFGHAPRDESREEDCLFDDIIPSHKRIS